MLRIVYLDMIDGIESNPRIEKSIEIEDLKPPKPPKPVKEPIKSSTIDFNKIANKSYFQRFIQELFKDIIPEQFKGVDFRVSKEKAVEIFDEKISEIRRGSAGDYKKCMNELNEKLVKQKVKVENESNNTVVNI